MGPRGATYPDHAKPGQKYLVATPPSKCRWNTSILLMYVYIQAIFLVENVVQSVRWSIVYELARFYFSIRD